MHLDLDVRGPSERQLLVCGIVVLVVIALVTTTLLVKSMGRLENYVRVVAELVNDEHVTLDALVETIAGGAAA